MRAPWRWVSGFTTSHAQAKPDSDAEAAPPDYRTHALHDETHDTQQAVLTHVAGAIDLTKRALAVAVKERTLQAGRRAKTGKVSLIRQNTSEAGASASVFLVEWSDGPALTGRRVKLDALSRVIWNIPAFVKPIKFENITIMVESVAVFVEKTRRRDRDPCPEWVLAL